MSDNYGFKNHQQGIYFVTLTIVEWIDLFTRKELRLLIVNSLNFCIKEKGLIVYAWVIMPSHIHMIISAKRDFELSDIMRDFKKFTSKKIVSEIKVIGESRRGWLLKMFERAGEYLKRIKNYKVWKDGNKAKGIETVSFMNQKLDYIHKNPVEDMIVENPEDYLFSSARDYCGRKGLVAIEFLK
ncbi:REP-associated tyrosine transposase [Sporocytophaga myxococcoides]|uniref:REP-associated tyrosine transposase n=1 Tax=Sporocytophaga myxococcoides TaxID=153721 RepID=UPI000404D386|nr:transposase [Sporocytophaga myxococcoides]